MPSNARLLVEIIASLGTFKEDMGRAAAIAESNAARINKSLDRLGGDVLKSFAKGLAAYLSVDAIVSFTQETIASAAALNQLAGATGSSVADLSQLANQAKIAGVDFATLQNALFKMSVSMSGTDKESTDAARALKVLGVTASDPAKALQEVAVSLDKYADGIGKVAIARALFGKDGAAFVSTLKDIAAAQDVGATVTAKQAAEAENLEKALRRLSVESVTFKNAILNDVVPALTAIIEQMREGIRVAGGFGAALLNFGTINPLKDVAENLRDTDERIKNITAGSGSAEARWLAALGISDKVLSGLRQRREFLQFQQRQQALAGAAALGDLSDQVSRAAGRKPKLEFTLGAAKEGRIAGMSDAERYLQNLEKQLERTQELTVVEQVLIDIQKKRVVLSGGITEETLTRIARQIDQANAEKKAREALARQMEEEARIRERNSQAATRELLQAGAETQRLADANDALKDEIALIGADEKKRLELTQARIDSTIALKEEQAAMLANAGGSEALVASLEDQIRILKERKSLLSQKGIAEALIEDAKKLKEFNDIFVNAFADSAVAIATHTKSIADAFRDMERQIVASISRIAAQKIAEALFGTAVGSTGATGTFSSFTSALAGLFGIGGANPGGFSGTGFASGTDFAPGGVSLVGERGPELVNLPRGAQVIPNEVLSSRRAARSTTIVQHINVLPGATTKSATQAAMLAGIQAQRALSRNA